MKDISEGNLCMKCEAADKAAFRGLPEHYSFRLCRENELSYWKRMMFSGLTIVGSSSS